MTIEHFKRIISGICQHITFSQMFVGCCDVTFIGDTLARHVLTAAMSMRILTAAMRIVRYVLHAYTVISIH